MSDYKGDAAAIPGGCVTFALLAGVSVLVIAITMGCGWLITVAVNGVP